MEYLASGGVLHSLDMTTRAKVDFLERLRDVILRPRGLDYKVQFPGPTGTNAVEAALKLARKVTGRRTVVAFSNGFHGMTLGSLAVTANPSKRAGAGVPLEHTITIAVRRQPARRRRPRWGSWRRTSTGRRRSARRRSSWRRSRPRGA